MNQGVFQINEARLGRLRYILLSGSDAPPEFRAIHDCAYELWKLSWQETFAELKSDARVRADDFVRQDAISCLCEGDRAIGLLLHTHFNLELSAVRDHGYLATYPADVIDKIRAESTPEVLSMEYLTLDSRWRQSAAGVPLGEVLLGLGAKLSEVSEFGSMIVVTRNDRRVNEILYGYGARCLAADLRKHNVSVDLVSLDKGKTHPGKNPEVNRWIDYYWGRRVAAADFNGLARIGVRKKAA